MLVIYQSDTYETIDEQGEQILIRKPFARNSKPFWVLKGELIEYPRTYESILKRWLPDYYPIPGWYEAEVYVLEMLSALLTPTFLLAPKGPGVYTAIWMDKTDHLQVAWLLYNPNDSSLSESDQLEGYDTFIVHKKYWVPLRFYIANEDYRFLRFIPFNLGYTYTYLQHLIETEQFTRAEVEQIWQRDRDK